MVGGHVYRVGRNLHRTGEVDLLPAGRRLIDEGRRRQQRPAAVSRACLRGSRCYPFLCRIALRKYSRSLSSGILPLVYRPSVAGRCRRRTGCGCPNRASARASCRRRSRRGGKGPSGILRQSISAKSLTRYSVHRL